LNEMLVKALQQSTVAVPTMVQPHDPQALAQDRERQLLDRLSTGSANAHELAKDILVRVVKEINRRSRSRSRSRSCRYRSRSRLHQSQKKRRDFFDRCLVFEDTPDVKVLPAVHAAFFFVRWGAFFFLRWSRSLRTSRSTVDPKTANWDPHSAPSCCFGSGALPTSINLVGQEIAQRLSRTVCHLSLLHS